MPKIKRTETVCCLVCSQIFLASKKEVNRGNAKYCSLSCAAIANNKIRLQHAPELHLSCEYCGTSFTTKSSHQKFCCHRCKNRASYRKRRNGFKESFKELRKKPCEVCGWQEAARDLHHIIPVSKGGEDVETNVACLCPNHHRLADRNLLSQDDLQKIVKSRTISSSGYPELDALGGITSQACDTH